MSLFNELKRRNVFRVVGAYLVMSWLLLQVADVVLDAFNVPDWTFRFLIIALGIGLVPAAVFSWVFEMTPDAAPDANSRSIAVLPFVNMSSDPENEYFADCLSEELLNQLAQVPDLQVAGRTSSFTFKGKNEDPHQISGQGLVNAANAADDRLQIDIKKAQSVAYMTIERSMIEELDYNESSGHALDYDIHENLFNDVPFLTGFPFLAPPH